MDLKVYNYLTRQLELFEPEVPGRVGMYVCGPTVYDHSHLGHAKTYVAMDVIVRYFKHLGYHVRHVRNITDVGHLLASGEDRIAKGARRYQLEPMEVVETYMASFFADMDSLKVWRPNISPRASGHVPEIIQWVQGLIKRGYAYEVEGDVYFSVEKFEEYGKLSRRKLEDLEAGARVQVREEKRHPADFALWKRADAEHLMRWPSPWGEGYPGWHIECSVMSTKYLGQPFDIHGGGLENIFPHNEGEVAQAEAYHDAQFVNYWLLTGSLTVDGVKMSKSLGNFLTIKDALQLYTPEALRYFILSSHYRGPLDFSQEALDAAQRGVDRMHSTVRKLRQRIKSAPPAGTAMLSDVSCWQDYRTAFEAAMSDDFNTPQALGTLFEFVKEVNRYLGENAHASVGTMSTMDRLFTELAGDVLGILPTSFVASVESEELVVGLMDLILTLRQEYRAARDWTHSDYVRSCLTELGITVNDSAGESTWQLEH
ncbi:MAG: cysteine--tRNA ligase [Chloroflexota bacterium]|nr:cysteine--tRNA ligase [Chloroflexota bacterium]